tara:strand:- start:42 stop:584 length:543 start_codon:yes stop_codon:yes gene_type:complete
MSTLETNLIQPSTGTSLTIGASGDTITIPTGASTSGVGQIKKITVNEGITTQYSGLGSGDTTLTDIKVIHTALSTSNKLGFYISIPYTLYSGTYVGITNFKLNDGSSDIKTGLYYNYNGGTGAGEQSINAMTFDITPGSTSAVTYTCKATIYRPSGSSTVTIGDSNYPSKVICVEYGANV